MQASGSEAQLVWAATKRDWVGPSLLSYIAATGPVLLALAGKKAAKFVDLSWLGTIAQRLETAIAK